MKPLSIAVATPTHHGMLCEPYVAGLCELQALCLQQGIGFELLTLSHCSVIAHARNHLAGRFLWKTNHSHILFIDDDMGFNADEVMQMLQWPQHPVVAAMYPKRAIDWQRIKDVVLKHPDINPEILPYLVGDYRGMFHLSDAASTMPAGSQPVRVDGIGTGLMLISREILLHLIDAAPLPPIHDKALDFPMHEFFRSTMDNGRPTGEDINFCNLVRHHGGEIYGCPWLTVTHTGHYSFIGTLKGIADYT